MTAGARVNKQEVFEWFQAWAAEEGVQPLTRIDFFRRLTAVLAQRQIGEGLPLRLNVRLSDEACSHDGYEGFQ